MPVTIKVIQIIWSTFSPWILADSCANNVLSKRYSLHTYIPTKPNTINTIIKAPLILLLCLRLASAPLRIETCSLALAI